MWTAIEHFRLLAMEIEEKDADASGNLSCPLLRISGFSPEDENFHELWLKKILESDFDFKFLTNGIILELWSLVEVVSPGSDQVISPGKMSRRQFAQLVRYILFREISVTNDFIKIIASKRDFDRLSKIVNSEEDGQSEVWPKAAKIVSKAKKEQEARNNEKPSDKDSLPVPTSSTMSIPEKEATGELFENSFDDEMDLSTDKYDKNSNPHLVKMGLLDETSQSLEILLSRMESWKPSQDDVTNGLVLEVVENFGGNLAAVTSLSLKIIQILDFHPSKQNSAIVQRFCQYFKCTNSKMSQRSESLEDKWTYFKDLSPGGKLFKLDMLVPHSKFGNMLERMKSLESSENHGKSKTCKNCWKTGDFYSCQGCFFAFYCSKSCQNLDWMQTHKNECKEMAGILIQEGAQMPPEKTEVEDLDIPSGSIRDKYRISLKRISFMERKSLQLEDQFSRAEDDIKHLEECKCKDEEIISDLKAEIDDLNDVIAKLKKGKAGKASAYVKLKRKIEELDSDDDEDDDNIEVDGGLQNKSTQTKVSLYPESTILAIRNDATTGLKNVDLFKGRELELSSDGKRKYGESSYVRLSSSRATIWPNMQVSSKAVRARALAAKDLISLISGSCSLPPVEAAKNDEVIFAYLVRQNPDLFRNLLKSNTEVLSIVMKMGPGETARFMHSANISYSAKRKMSTMFGKIFNFNVFSSEKKQRAFENEKKGLVERSKLEHGTLLMKKTATAEHTTLCSFVRVSDLASFVSELYALALLEDIFDPTSMKNLQHPLYQGKLWVVIGGDKGAQTMKFVVGVGGHDPHIFGMFEAADTPANLLCFQSSYIEQIRKLVAFGIDVSLEDEPSKVLEVEVFANGDKAYLSDQIGHAGAAASFPSIYRLVPSSHLRKSHLDGSPHNLSNPDCVFQARTPKDIDRDYHENVTDTRAGDIRKRGKHHHSIVGPRLLPLESVMNFCISSLHIGLAIVLRIVDYIETDCDIIDGTKSVTDKKELEARFDELEGLIAENNDDIEVEDVDISEVEDVDISEVIDDEDEMLTDVMRSNKVSREILDAEWEEKSLEVMKEEAAVKEMSEQITDKFSLLDRLKLVEDEDKSGLEKLAKKASKMSYCLKSFGKWQPMDSWHCDSCLLTGYDRDIQWRVCTLCNKKTHVFCQAFSDSELAEMSAAGFECRPCSGITLLSQIKVKILEEISKLKIKSAEVTANHSRLQQEQSSLKHQCTRLMGATRLKLQEVLEKNLGVSRSDYHSHCFVGNHCDKIVENYKVVTEVLASKPELKAKYDEFMECYKPLHFLMKANRFLTPGELDLIDNLCAKIGEVYPKNFRATIPPKLDDLIFIVPKFARQWNTIGGLREEKIEAFHNISKYFLRFGFG